MLHKLLRAGCWMVFCASLLTVLGGGSSCSSCSGSGCDDDDHDDDGQESGASPPEAGSEGSGGNAARGLGGTVVGPLFRLRDGGASDPGAALAGETYRLARYELVPASGADEHPVAALRCIEGLCLSSTPGAPGAETSAFRAFTEQILGANLFLDLPPEAGRLAAPETWLGGNLVLVVWRQDVDLLALDRRPARPGQLTFVFDRVGQLLQIENTTQFPAGVGPLALPPRVH